MVSTSSACTVGEAIEAIGMGRGQWQLTYLIGTLWIWGGATSASMVWMLLDMQERMGMGSVVLGTMSAAQSVGMGIGSLGSGYLADRFGCRRILILSISCHCICQASIAISISTNHVLVSVALKTMFYAGMKILSKSLLAEILPAAHRGVALNALHVAWQFGAISVVCVSFVTTNFRVIALSTAAPGWILMIMATGCIPESPRWLLLRWGAVAAAKGLADLAARNGVQTTALPLQSWEQLEAGSRASLEKGPSLLRTCGTLLHRPLRSITFGVLVMMLALHYAVPGTDSWLLRFLGASGKKHLQRTLSFVQCGSKILGGIYGVAQVDRIGRRRLLVRTFLFAGLGLAAVATCSSSLALCLSVSFFYFNSEAMVSTLVTYVTEVFPSEIRNSATGLMFSVASLGAVVSSLTFPVLMDAWVSLPFVLASVTLLLGAVNAAMLTVETSGVSLQ